jgi:hypothetical protein
LEKLDSETPLLTNPYSKIWSGIQQKTIKHDQRTFGPDADPKTNLCKTQMCTAGHLVNMGGALGYKLKNKYGWVAAARLIHDKAHPGWPCQNFGSIAQNLALAYLKEMAAHEEAGTNPDWGKK